MIIFTADYPKLIANTSTNYVGPTSHRLYSFFLLPWSSSSTRRPPPHSFFLQWRPASPPSALQSSHAHPRELPPSTHCASSPMALGYALGPTSDPHILHGLLLLHAAAEMEDLPRDPLMDLLSSSGRLPATLLRLLQGPRSPSLNIRKDLHNTRPGSRHGRLCFVAGRRSNGAGRAEKSGAPTQPPIGGSASVPCFSPTSREEEVRFWQLLKNFWYWGTYW